MSMKLFRRHTVKEINLAVDEFRQNTDSLLIDVRSPEEYYMGHISGSINIPVDRIDTIETMARDFDQTIYLYCQSGYRSRKAYNYLQQAGYLNAVDLGSVALYSGKLEH